MMKRYFRTPPSIDGGVENEDDMLIELESNQADQIVEHMRRRYPGLEEISRQQFLHLKRLQSDSEA